MFFFGDTANKGLCDKVATELETEVFYPEVHVFADGEKRVRILQDVLGQDTYVLKSHETPIGESVLEFCFIVDALNRHGAKSVSGIVPYIGYMRADHVFRTGEAVPLEVLIRTMEATGLNKIWFVDPHSIKIPEMFTIPHVSNTALPLFTQKIHELAPDLGKVSVVSPDMGGIRRIKLLSEALGGGDYAVINKDRDYETGQIKVASMKGEIRPICFITDDIISSGRTVAQAVEHLLTHGAEKVYVMATHALLAEDASGLLQASGAEKVFVTDSLSVPEEKRFEKLEVLTLAPQIATQIRKWNAEGV